MNTSQRLGLEALEDRTAPSAFGVPWPDPQHLTLSFVPDGTPVVGQNQTSRLVQTLNARESAGVWQTQILRAFQTWAVNANINVGVVADDGSPLGVNGAPQGDPRFGDVRVATYPLAADAVAVASPFDVLASTWGGDVKLNPAYAFGGAVDLFSVMLHEAG